MFLGMDWFPNIRDETQSGRSRFNVTCRLALLLISYFGRQFSKVFNVFDWLNHWGLCQLVAALIPVVSHRLEFVFENQWNSHTIELIKNLEPTLLMQVFVLIGKLQLVSEIQLTLSRSENSSIVFPITVILNFDWVYRAVNS